MESEQIVVFAGAGISMGPPSCLPNWWTLNEWILSALRQRIGREFGIEADYERILVEYRNCSPTYPPDYQAQFLAECADLDYFRALAALDIAAPNRCHHALAVLARAGRLAAVVTTNFDCMIEQALEAAGVRFRVASEAKSFFALQRALEQVARGDLPVIKVHGSTKDPSSMVDTLKQRRRGRGPALVRALAQLLRRHSFLYVGFSGADLEQDRHYLGLWDAAEASPGFRFLHQPGTKPKDVVLELKQHYGDKAEVVEVDGTTALEALAGSSGPPSTSAESSTENLVQNRLRALGRGSGSMALPANGRRASRSGQHEGERASTSQDGRPVSSRTQRAVSVGGRRLGEGPDTSRPL